MHTRSFVVQYRFQAALRRRYYLNQKLHPSAKTIYQLVAGVRFGNGNMASRQLYKVFVSIASEKIRKYSEAMRDFSQELFD